MLAALLQNNNNGRQTQPGFKVDPRSSVGRSRHDSSDEQRWGRHDVTDVIAAAAVFPEIAGEDPAARANRRVRWIGEALPLIRDAREKREAAAFLSGVQLGAAAERAEREASEKISIEQLIQIIDEVRATAPVTAVDKQKHPTPVPHSRGAGAGRDVSGPMVALGLLLGGVMIGSLISGKSRRRRRVGH